uniref:Uncharacterized protein n=1 Tax=Arundo donax TaxID=35708 RepID=A0A0A8ZKF2_ARUDO
MVVGQKRMRYMLCTRYHLISPGNVVPRQQEVASAAHHS